MTRPGLLIFCNLVIHFCIAQDWKLHIIDDAHSGADGVRISDIDGDGLKDIATGWEETGLTKIYLHPGFDLVREKWPATIVGKTPSVEDAVFIDLDNNGAYDVVSSTEGTSKQIFINWAPDDPERLLDSSMWLTRPLPASVGLMQWMFAIPMQVDGANGVDIVAGAKGDHAKIGWFRSPPDPRHLDEWEWYPIYSCGWVMSLFARDMDNDGDLDVVASDRRGEHRGVRWLENPGRGSGLFDEWENHDIGARDREVLFMDMADINDNGLEDIIVSEYTNQRVVFMKRRDLTGKHWTQEEISLPHYSGRAKSVRIGEIDLDGSPDLVHASETLSIKGKHGIIYASPEKGINHSGWRSISGLIGYKFDRIELLDLDGDGDLDVLTCEENYGENSKGLGVIWYENPAINFR